MTAGKSVLQVPGLSPFYDRVRDSAYEMTTDALSVLQINVGRRCNLSCRHCHLSCGPSRTEEMSAEVMEACLQVAGRQQVPTIDITGGAPEMYPRIRELIRRAAEISPHVIVRSNLVILTSGPYRDMIDFYVSQGVELVCSLPYYRAKETDAVRGDGTFERSVEAVRLLNQKGYGRQDGLVLNFVYNPAGAFFPPDQGAMEAQYRRRLKAEYDIDFHRLLTIANNPVGRFAEYLGVSGNLESYMHGLADAFNPGTLPGMMCRAQLSVGYDGTLYDCDFNQAAELPLTTGETIFDYAAQPYHARKICFGDHCYACTAGAGSSCGGATG